MRHSRAPLLLLLSIVSHGLTGVSAGYADQVPPPPQPNDISGTVNGCANAIMSHDLDGDGAIRRDEYLNFVNNVADLLCLPPRPILDLELQTVFVSIACLCQEREGNDISCCFGEAAGLYQLGADNPVGRTQDETSYLRAACLLTQAVLGPQQCETPVATIAPGAIVINIPAAGVIPPPIEEGPNLLWLLLLLLLLLLCCICCCCWRRDKEVEEEYEVVVTEEKIVEGPEEPLSDNAPPPQPEDVEQALVPPVDEPTTDKGIPPVPPDPEDPGEPFSAGDEVDEAGNAPRPGPPVVPMGAPGMGEAEDDEEDEENIGRKMGANPDDDEDEEGRRRFGGQGDIPNPPGPEGVVLRHIERETTEKGEYDYPERNINEFKYKREDSGQILPHEEIDSGVYIPTRPPREPVIMPKPHYERQAKPEPVYIDPRKERKQMGLGDGEVWDALNEWEDEQEKTGTFNYQLLLGANCTCDSLFTYFAHLIHVINLRLSLVRNRRKH